MSVGVFVHHPFGVNVLVFAVLVGGGCDGVKWWGAGGCIKVKIQTPHLVLLLFLSNLDPLMKKSVSITLNSDGAEFDTVSIFLTDCLSDMHRNV